MKIIFSIFTKFFIFFAAINIKHLHNELSKADAVIIYPRGSCMDLNETNYPELSNLIEEVPWIYLPQSSLTVESDLFKTEIYQATASTPQEQDKEIFADYQKVQERYKGESVIGILAMSDSDQSFCVEHSRFKRENYDYEYPKEAYVFLAPGRGILYTESPLILNDEKNKIIHELKHHTKITAEDIEYGDGYNSIFHLNIEFKIADKQVRKWRLKGLRSARIYFLKDIHLEVPSSINSS